MNTLLTIIALAFILIAVFLLIQHIYLWDAILLLSLAFISIIILLFRAYEKKQSPRQYLNRLIPRNWSSWLRILAVVSSLLVALNAKNLPMQSNFAPLFILWIVAVLAFLLTLIIPWIQQHHFTKHFSHKFETLALLALILMAGLCRFVELGTIPANLGGDEGTQLLIGTQLVSPPFGNPFATGWFSVPTLSFALYGLSMRIWGTTIAGGRMLSAIIGTCTVLLTYLLGKSMGGRRFGWVAAFCVAFSAYHIHYSRLASNQIFDPFIGTLAFWLIHKATKTTRELNAMQHNAWGLAGVVAGLGWYAYFGARWVTFLIGLVIFWRWFVQRNFLRTHAKGILLFALGWFIIVLPLLGWYYEHPSALSERYNAVSIFASGWLEREVVITGKTSTQLLLQQFWKSVTAFHLTPDPTFWYFPERPLVDMVTGLLMLTGMVVCLWQYRWPSKALTLLWFWSTLMMAWVLTENPPSSQRGLLLVPAVAFLAAWGFETLWAYLKGKQGPYRQMMLLFFILVVPLNLVFYFNTYTPRRSYGNPTAEIATKVAQYTLRHPMPVCVDAHATQCDGSIYFMGPPRLYWEFGSLAFMLRNFPGSDVMPGVIPQDITTPARFILVEGRMGEIGVLMQAYPDGQIAHIADNAAQTITLIYDWIP